MSSDNEFGKFAPGEGDGGGVTELPAVVFFNNKVPTVFQGKVRFKKKYLNLEDFGCVYFIFYFF